MLSVRINGPKPATLALNRPLSLGAEQGLGGGEVQLTPHALGAVLCAAAAVTVGKASHPAGRRRLIRPGERLTLGGVVMSLELSARPEPSTRLLARALLAGDQAVAPNHDVPRLIWLTGDALGRELLLSDGATFLGRGEGCAARIEDPKCSRIHAKVVRDGWTARLVDLGAPNGITVDGVRLSGSITLSGGETLCIGETQVRVELPVPPPSAVAAPPPTPPLPQDVPAPTSHPAARVPPHPPRLSKIERVLLGVAATAVLVGGLLVGWAVR
jgi:hypothetical protein